MPSFWDYLIPGGVSSARSREAADALRGQLGYEGDPSTFKSYDISYDDQGNEVRTPATARESLHGAHGLLADQSYDPGRMRLAATMMEHGQDSIASNILVGEINTARELDKLTYQYNQSKDAYSALRDRIVNSRGGNGIVAPRSIPSPISPASPNVASPPGISPVGAGLPTGSQGAPALAPPRALPDPMSQVLPTGYNMPRSQPTMDEQVTKINSIYSEAMMDPRIDKDRLKTMWENDIKQATGGFGTTDYRNYQIARGEGYTGDFQKWIADTRKTIQTEKTGVVPITDLRNIIDTQTKRTPSYGLTFDDVKANPDRYQVATTQEQKDTSQQQASNAIVSSIEDYLFGPSGLLVDENGQDLPSSFWDRLKQAPGTAWNYYSQEDPRVKAYEDYRTSTIAPFFKSLGAAGALSDEDIARAEKLYPSMMGDFGVLPDTPKVARKKIEDMRNLVNKGLKNQQIIHQMGIFKGYVEDGMMFTGGDPTKATSWKEVGDQ